MGDDSFKDIVHGIRSPFELYQMAVKEADISPRKEVRDIKGHRFHLGQKTLCGKFCREEIDAEVIVHTSPDKLLGKD
jgi:hypothetical protein